MIDFDYLNSKLERTPTISARQHYVAKILRNRKTDSRDKRAILAYVRRRPDLFVPFDETVGSPQDNEVAKKRNGPDARDDFFSWVQITFMVRCLFC